MKIPSYIWMAVGTWVWFTVGLVTLTCIDWFAMPKWVGLPLCLNFLAIYAGGLAFGVFKAGMTWENRNK